MNTELTFSMYYHNDSLCKLHDRAEALYDKYVDTEFSWLLIADYSTLVNALDEYGEAMHADILLLLVYKQNVYEIDAANDARNADAHS